MDKLLPTVSIVVPMFNESENVAPLMEKIHHVLGGYRLPWEIIAVDDGSGDDTVRRLQEARRSYGNHVIPLPLQRNFGQTAAMQAGIDAARGDIIVTIDGDLQNDPRDIPRLVDRLLADDLDLLVGRRRDRKDNLLIRTIPSRLANFLIGAVTGVKIHDYGCTLKIYRGSVIRQVRLYGEMHRFIPAWVATVTAPERIAEEVVLHHPRRFGKSNYGISRTFRIILDLLSVYFFMRFRARPGHFFGLIGLLFGFLGGLTLGYLSVVKFYLGEDIGTRPLLLVGIFLVVTCFQFLTTGVITELMARTYFESSAVRSYLVREASPGIDGENDWRRPPGSASGKGTGRDLTESSSRSKSHL